MKLKKSRKKNSSHLILSNFIKSDTVIELEETLNSDIKNIFFNGNIGSSLALYSASILLNSNKNHLFIKRDKEEALYFTNDLENILTKEVLFFPASFRRSYQFNETDNSNVLLRSEVLNKLNNKKNNIIITYPEAISEKVIHKTELRKKL